MSNVVKRIVLTGGPCAGKSSSLELIDKYLKSKGYIVYIVQESATELINSGIKPFGENAITMYKFQEILMSYQINKENLVNKIANELESDKEIVIIYDRGLLDNKAYVSSFEFNKLLVYFNLTEQEILDKYDLVIHLESAAKSDFYTIDNNKARSEDKLLAIEMDDKNFEVWSSHTNLEYVQCFDDFKLKQDKILGIITKNFSYKKLILK